MFRLFGFSVAFLTAVCLASTTQAQIIYNASNDHYYERVQSRISWQGAEADARARTYQGYSGYLVTLTSQEETDFVVSGFGGSNISDYHIGAFQSSNSTTTSENFQWVTGETWDYTNWGGSEPNDGGDNIENGQENAVQLAYFASNGSWNDIPLGYNGSGFVVEYARVVPAPSALAAFVIGAVPGAAMLLRRRRKA